MENDIPDGSLLYLSDARGIYIPQNFAEETFRHCVTGVTDGDWNTLLTGPDHECYWEVWEIFCNNAVVTDPKSGEKYSIYQDGDCWLIPIESEPTATEETGE